MTTAELFGRDFKTITDLGNLTTFAIITVLTVRGLIAAGHPVTGMREITRETPDVHALSG